METVVGRAIEQSAVDSLLRPDHEALPLAVVLCGDAGIGKSCLWAAAVARAVQNGTTVLAARAVEAEVQLPWVTLTDLLCDLDPATWEPLPEPQRHALEVATLRAAPSATALDFRTVATALAGLLAALARDGGFLLAIDDLGYADELSNRAVTFAVRRLTDTHGARILLTARGDSTTVSEHSLIDALPASRRQLIALQPMTVTEIGALLRARSGTAVAPSLLRAIHATAAGNPLYALELASAIDRGEIEPGASAPLPVPHRLAELVAGRVDRLDAEVRILVASTVAVSHLPSSAVPHELLTRAAAMGLVVLDGSLVRAAHPLIGAAAYGGLGGHARAALHRRLASLTDDSVERARHLALAHATPDPEIASALDLAADETESRAGPSAAAVLAKLAVDHTADDRGALIRRLSRLGDLQFRAGDVADATASLRAAVATAHPGPVRARLRVRLAEVLAESEGLASCVDELLATLPESVGDANVEAEVHLTLSAVYYADIDESAAHADRAIELLDAVTEPEPEILAGALCQRAGARFRGGRGLDHESFRRAIELEREFPGRRLSDRADAGYAALLKYADELDDAEAMLGDLLSEAVTTHDVSGEAYVRAHLPQIALWRGDVAGARHLAEQHLDLADATGQSDQTLQAHYLLGLVAAHEGDARAAADHFTIASPDGHPWALQRVRGARGFLAISQGDVAAALDHLTAWWQLSADIGLREPGLSRFHVDHALALTGGGRIDEAIAFAKALDEQARLSGRKSAAAAVELTFALVAAHQQRHDEARDHMERCLAIHGQLPLRFERARAWLISGRLYRRAKAKRSARDDLTAALTEFEAFGTPLWAEQARAELQRVNIRTSSATQLTATERRVAELMAAGLSNREIASTLFLSPKTVEANITKVYRKLGVSSRTAVAAQLAHDLA